MERRILWLNMRFRELASYVWQVGKLKAQDFTLKFAFTYYLQICHLQTYYP